MNWKALYRIASEEPVSKALIEFRLRLAFAIMPKPVRSLALPLLSTASELVHQELEAGKKNIFIDVAVTGTNEE